MVLLRSPITANYVNLTDRVFAYTRLMDSLQALVDELDGQLVGATRLASTRAEHLRLTQMAATLDRLRAMVATAPLAPTA